VKKLITTLLIVLLLATSFSIPVFAAPCAICNGGTITCSFCHGTGKATQFNVAPSDMIENADCPRCGGTGSVKCTVCNGTGEGPSGGSNSSGNNAGNTSNALPYVNPNQTYEVRVGETIKMRSGTLDAIPGTNRWVQADYASGGIVFIGEDLGTSGSEIVYFTGNKVGTATVRYTYSYTPPGGYTRDSSFVFYIKVTEGNSSSETESSAPVDSSSKSEPSTPSETTPPATTGKVTVGNTSGNLANGGAVVESGGYIYQSHDNARLVKAHADGTATEITGDNPRNINVIGDWIYYQNIEDHTIYKIKTNGTERQQISQDKNYHGLVAAGEWLYYSNGSDDSKLYKMKTDGSGSKKLSNYGAFDIYVAGEWIYYNNLQGIYKVKTDGTGNTKLCGDGGNTMNVIADWIYYVNRDDSKIYKIKTDGTGRTKLSDNKYEYVNVSGGWVYCTGKDGLYRIKTDGTGRQRLKSGNIGATFLTKDWIYFYETENSNAELCRAALQ